MIASFHASMMFGSMYFVSAGAYLTVAAFSVLVLSRYIDSNNFPKLPLQGPRFATTRYLLVHLLTGLVLASVPYVNLLCAVLSVLGLLVAMYFKWLTRRRQLAYLDRVIRERGLAAYIAKHGNV